MSKKSTVKAVETVQVKKVEQPIAKKTNLLTTLRQNSSIFFEYGPEKQYGCLVGVALGSKDLKIGEQQFLFGKIRLPNKQNKVIELPTFIPTLNDVLTILENHGVEVSEVNPKGSPNFRDFKWIATPAIPIEITSQEYATGMFRAGQITEVEGEA